MIINPLFCDNQEKNKKHKITAALELSPISNKPLEEYSIVATDGRVIPVQVDFENRVCLPIKKDF